eukprot:7388143-Pyramimonas_sp.AAC.1
MALRSAPELFAAVFPATVPVRSQPAWLVQATSHSKFRMAPGRTNGGVRAKPGSQKREQAR